MLGFFRTFRTFLLVGRLAAFAVVLVVGSCTALFQRLSDRLHYRAIQARVDRVAVNCRTPGGDADCTILSAMGTGKPGMGTDPHTTVFLRYFSPADGKEHAASVERDGDLSRTVHAGGSIQISANTLDAETIR